MISRCCCPLWLNIQTKSVLVCVLESTFLRADPSFYPSLPPAAIPNCTASRGLTGGSPLMQHTPTLLTSLPTSTRVAFLVSYAVLFRCRNRSRGDGQLWHFHVDHDAGGAERGEADRRH